MRLLIAEDDKALGLFLSRGLEADGHRVRLAYDGGAAVEAFRQDLPDLTILDLNMPVKDGEQVLEEVRLLNQVLPVLVLTARQEVDTRVRCLDRGADDLMVERTGQFRTGSIAVLHPFGLHTCKEIPDLTGTLLDGQRPEAHLEAIQNRPKRGRPSDNHAVVALDAFN